MSNALRTILALVPCARRQESLRAMLAESGEHVAVEVLAAGKSDVSRVSGRR